MSGLGTIVRDYTSSRPGATIGGGLAVSGEVVRDVGDTIKSWLLAQKPWIVQIPGTTRLHRLEENIGAVKVALTPKDLREIDTAAAKIQIQGARLPEAVLKMTGR